MDRVPIRDEEPDAVITEELQRQLAAGVTARDLGDLRYVVVNRRAYALLMLAVVLDVRDLGGHAAAARREAIAKLRAKGNLAAVARLGA